MDGLKLKLAEYAHEAWSGWMQHMFGLCKRVKGTLTFDETDINRWLMQMDTHYIDLPEEMKASDLEQADKIMELIKACSFDGQSSHDFFKQRTEKHINLVKTNAYLLSIHLMLSNTKLKKDILELMGELQSDFLLENVIKNLLNEVPKHDHTKYSPELYEYYVEITDYYRRKNSGDEVGEFPEYLKSISDKHCKAETHHPEWMQENGKPWELHHILECCCDLMAMSQELNNNPVDYLNNQWVSSNDKYFDDTKINKKIVAKLMASVLLFLQQNEK